MPEGEKILHPANDQALRINEVCAFVGLSAPTIYRYVQRGDFPAPVRLTPGGASRWSRNAVTSWWERKQTAPAA